MNDLEQLPPSNMAKFEGQEIKEPQELAILEEEKINLERQEFSEDNFTDKDSELFSQERIRIEARINELKQLITKREQGLKVFLENFPLILSITNDPVNQMRSIQQGGYFDKLPKQVVLGILENFRKYNFIDYKLAEIALEDDPYERKLLSLLEYKQKMENNILENSESAFEDLFEQGDETIDIDYEEDGQEKLSEVLEENLEIFDETSTVVENNGEGTNNI